MNGNEENYRLQIHHYRQNYEKNLVRMTDSPIIDKKKFQGLTYFPENINYVVNAKMERIKTFQTKEILTNQQVKTFYIYYATLHFELQGKKCELILFQNQEDVTEFFLPFTDETNGKTSYESGRYLNVSPSDNGIIELDFNKAYNPYCAYNADFSCPIPPKENFLALKIEAGEKTFSKK